MRLAALLLAVFVTHLHAQAPDTVTLNFVNADIEGVVKAVSEITGKNFVLDPRVKGTVNIVSARPVSRAQVYEIFLSALRLQGYAAVEERGMVQIVPEADAKLHPGRGQVQTQVFTLKYESAAQLVPILRPLISPNNTITSYPGTNTLVVTDYADNVIRLRKEGVARGHVLRHHHLEPAEELLVLELLVGETHQRLDHDLVAEDVAARDLQQLRADEALDQAEHVGVGAALHLREHAALDGVGEPEAVDAREAVGQEFLGEVELAAANHVAVDVPAHALRGFDALRVARGVGGDIGIHAWVSPGFGRAENPARSP